MPTITTPDVIPSDLQIVKIREMRKYLNFALDKSSDGKPLLKPASRGQGFEKDAYQPHELRKEVEPWLTALFQSEHFSLLVGSGLTNALHHKIAGQLPKGFSLRNYAAFNDQIQFEAKQSASTMGRGDANPEDQLRTALRIANGLRVLLQSDDNPKHWKDLKDGLEALSVDINSAIKELVVGILESEHGIIKSTKESEEALTLLISFLMSFASRTGTRDRLHIFTTNYDRLIEFGSELAGIRLIDRFVGALSPIFRSSRLDIDYHYNPPGIRGEPRYLEGVARFTKLHGSLDWINDDHQVRRIALPFGTNTLDSYFPKGIDNVLVYPNDAKDRETTDYPYVELHRDFAASLCRPNSVLVTYGYSFGDDHINRVIRDMLTIPSTHLIMINYGDTGSRLTGFYAHSQRTSQISLLIGNHVGDISNLVDFYLPKPAIDRSSIRMADLLRARGISEGHSTNPQGVKGKTESEQYTGDQQ
jgi:SIR2-like domain